MGRRTSAAVRASFGGALSSYRQGIVLAPGIAVFPRRRSVLLGCTWVIGALGASFPRR
jgi:hypothetical protein